MRSASPTSICLPFTESCMFARNTCLGPVVDQLPRIAPTLRRRPYESAPEESSARRPLSEPHRLLATALHRGWNAQRFPIFGNGAPGDVDAVLRQDVDDALVRQNLAAGLGVDQRLDAKADGFGGVRVAAARGLDR